MTDNKRHYVNNRVMYEAIKEWYASGKEEPPHILVDGIIQICEGLGKRFNFRGYTYVEDMIAQGIEKCASALVQKKFDPEKYDKPYSYFNRIAWNEFVQYIKDEKKQTYIKQKSLEYMIRDSMFDEHPVDYSALEGKMNEHGQMDDTMKMFDKKKD